MKARAEHQHESWHIREAPDGTYYCAACGKTVPAPKRSSTITERLVAQEAALSALITAMHAEQVNPTAAMRTAILRVGDARKLIVQAQKFVQSEEAAPGMTLIERPVIMGSDGEDHYL